MEDYTDLRFDKQDGVATVTLNRPDKLNALTFKMVKGVTDFVEECGWDPDVRVIVITGAGRAFCSGDDIVGGMGERPGPPLATPSNERGPHYRMVKTLLSTPKPVIAALNGRCHGAGWVMALSCDFRVARSDALIGDIRAGKAIFANQGVGLLLPRLIGQSRAMDMLMTGRVIDAVEAERFGIVVRLWPPETWESELASFVAELASGPTRNYAAWKLSVNRSVLLELDAYTDYERLLNAGLAESEDRREGVQAFREKRVPRFTGR
ncbi:MAG: enoyl-CoA hydratase/isomerase family protein [Chloroflexi bacterium]|nr:enoyl-CoA hydratase/isomerase family protein [Chloroflexota bacterium]